MPAKTTAIHPVQPVAIIGSLLLLVVVLLNEALRTLL
jgi:hypothetical protein